MQVLYNLVISVYCLHRTVYQSFLLTLNAISRSFKFKSLKSSQFVDFLSMLLQNYTNKVSFMQI